MRKLWFITILLLALSAAVHFRIQKHHNILHTSLSQMLYLPSGKYLKPASFGYHTLVADFIYLWSIQYYTDPGFHPRVAYLKHTYDVIAELDPYFIDAYKTGALLLIYEGNDPEGGLRLLDEGFRRNPLEWILPTDAGFYCMMTFKDNKRAASYFEKASAVPDAPTMLKRFHASLRFKMGEKLLAYQLWQEVYDSAERETVRVTARQHLHDLKVLLDLDLLKEGIHQFRLHNQKNPLNLQQLVAQGFLKYIPLDPEEDEYVYDSRSGEVKYSQQLTLYKRYQ